jgi:hypothetical protein
MAHASTEESNVRPEPRLVTAVSPFRLFGPPPGPQPAATSDDLDGVTWAPGPWTGDPAPATRHARPVGLDTRPPYRHDDDPPTDPHGFPPIPATPLAAWRQPAPPPAPVEPPPDPREAAALAGAFAADYLSWDEDDPGRRGRVLVEHLGAPAGDPALLGWDGIGRQRAEFALPGSVRPDGDDRVLVDVRVRVTPYRAVGERASDEVPEPDVPGVPAAAPAPTAQGWQGCASYWVRLIVPVVREDGRLVVDARDETPPEGPAVTEGEPESRVADPDAAAEPRREPPVSRVPELEPEEAW